MANVISTWKEFEQNIVTHSAAHHLMAIAQLLYSKGYARVTDVARALGITRGSASITLKALKGKGYVKEDENRFLLLTEKGDRLSQSIHSTRKILIKFLQDVLQVNPEQAEIDACKVEHLISEETGDKLLSFLKFLFSKDFRSKSFLDAYWSYENVCQGVTQECGVCDIECLLPMEKHH
ncbi:metal-dependent transcriptional regulator [candidate division KSB1 bacterium]|nr:metal-dependent transcriptional regulator [candidate division KSB1 bacterium]NIR70971.1 metal-dependent transcriptional regulator [candidate division KSB1 bacterium]NIS24707.1 metal-dependent transcriptional regulator [candidate division KSB1 bacterium]NIT71616.1 metal-dependent transcriptional regulator [candidate division KSB1 bacterium]NIU25320.1 metal-dependent transcriptional regulator [candidate division KSB1 bacterium]